MLSSIFNIEKQVPITFIASFLIWLMVGGLIYLWIFRKKMNSRFVFYVFAVWFITWVISEFLKDIIPIQRPFVVSGAVPLTITVPNDYSFPSAHASSAFALATSLRKYSTRLFFLYFIFAILVAMGRVLSQVHYFVDVLAGAVIGILAVVVLEKMGMEKLFKKFLA